MLPISIYPYFIAVLASSTATNLATLTGAHQVAHPPRLIGESLIDRSS